MTTIIRNMYAAKQRSGGNCSSTLEDKLVKFQKRAAGVILNCDCYTPSSELFKELNWQTFPERIT